MSVNEETPQNEMIDVAQQLEVVYCDSLRYNNWVYYKIGEICHIYKEVTNCTWEVLKDDFNLSTIVPKNARRYFLFIRKYPTFLKAPVSHGQILKLATKIEKHLERDASADVCAFWKSATIDDPVSVISLDNDVATTIVMEEKKERSQYVYNKLGNRFTRQQAIDLGGFNEFVHRDGRVMMCFPSEHFEPPSISSSVSHLSRSTTGKVVY